MDFSKIDTIVFSGGGIKGISYIGFMTALLEKINISQIKHYIGASAGGIFCYFLVLGYTLDEIKKILYNYDFANIFLHTDQQELLLDNLVCNLGYFDGNLLKNFFIELLEVKFDRKDITFIELYELTNIKLTLAVTNFTTQSLEYWNYISVPNISVIDGILSSSRVPLFFCPITINGNIYLDGGIINNYPINYIDIENINTVIGACITSKKEINEITELFNKNNSPSFENLINYFFGLLILTFQSKITIMDKAYLKRTVQLQNRYANFLDFNISDEIKDIMITSAYEKTKNNLF